MKFSFTIAIITLFVLSSYVTCQLDYEFQISEYEKSTRKREEELSRNVYYNDTCYQVCYHKQCDMRPDQFMDNNPFCYLFVVMNVDCINDKCLNATPDNCFSQLCPNDAGLDSPMNEDSKSIFRCYYDCKKSKQNKNLRQSP